MYQTLKTKKIEWDSFSQEEDDCALVVITSGFEDRAKNILTKLNLRKHNIIVLIYYKSKVKENNEAHRWFKDYLLDNNYTKKILEIPFSITSARDFEREFSNKLRNITPKHGKTIYFDVSGLPMHGMCIVMKSLRDVFPYHGIKILYTTAEDYFPTKSEYEKIAKREVGNAIDLIPPSMSTEMSDNLILDSFSGFRSKEISTCLLVFAGYEVHRAEGAVDHVNPSKLVLVYGRPGDEKLKWRLEMSERSHRNLQKSRVTSIEQVSTLDIGESIELIEEYYNMLFDDHNLVIAPICSKMQTIASYLLWEKYRDIQLVFPLPIKYLPSRFSKGIAISYEAYIPGAQERTT
ncbi:MAG: hypothetical protein KME69_13120 [Candidatus Thiodiazotropha sp. (ex Codakia orbicularis)]|nr:hypothetical protein [Candidatus Thiodiazotropha sp. (ex Codakia orbicularis)]